MHTKRLHALPPQQLLLPAIHIPQANIHHFPHADAVLLAQPSEDILALFLRQPREERNRHTVDIAAVADLRLVDVRVRVHPYEGHFPPEPLAYRARGAAHGADRDGVVAAEGEDEAALRGVGVDLRGYFAGDGRDSEGVFHVAVRGVGGGDQGGVGVDGVVMVEGIA